MNIEIKNLIFSYGKHCPTVLDGISLKVESGCVNVLLGLNGCGKTTLIKALAGLLKTIKGDILYGGKSIREYNIREFSKIVAYVPQKIFGIDDVLVGDYLTYGMVNTLRFYQSPKEDDKEKVRLLSEKMKISHLLNKKVGEISGGERQIVSLCASLVQNTEILLLDEPTSALDLKNQNMVLSMLRNIADEKDKTIILSTHNPNNALFLNSNAALMHCGNIIRYGKAKEIIDVGTLREIYGGGICLSKDLPYDEISFKK